MDIRDFIGKVDKIQSKEENRKEANKETLKEAVQFSMVGDNLDDIQNFLQIFKNAGVDAPKMDVATTTKDVEDIVQPDAVATEETTDEVPGKASTTPDPEVKDTNFMTKDIAGGINKAKKTYPKVSSGDNPMAMEQETIDFVAKVKEDIASQYKEYKAK
jgi:hypothetical protein